MALSTPCVHAAFDHEQVLDRRRQLQPAAGAADFPVSSVAASSLSSPKVGSSFSGGWRRPAGGWPAAEFGLVEPFDAVAGQCLVGVLQPELLDQEFAQRPQDAGGLLETALGEIGGEGDGAVAGRKPDGPQAGDGGGGAAEKADMPGIPGAGDRIGRLVGPEERHRDALVAAGLHRFRELRVDLADIGVEPVGRGVVVETLDPAIGRRVGGRVADDDRRRRVRRVIGVDRRLQVGGRIGDRRTLHRGKRPGAENFDARFGGLVMRSSGSCELRATMRRAENKNDRT